MEKKRFCRFAVLAIVVLAGLTQAVPAQAAVVLWDDDSGSHDFCTGQNWSTDSFPGTADYANVSHATNTTAVLSATAPPNAIARLYVGTDGLTGKLYIENQTLTVTTNNVYAGSHSTSTTGNGAIYQTGGTLEYGSTTHGYARLGYASTAYGYYSLSGTGTLKTATGMASSFIVGSNGIGAFEQSGGLISLSSNFFVAQSSTGYGVFNQTSGTLSCVHFAPVNVGYAVSNIAGTVTITGTTPASQAMVLGGGATGNGTTNLQATGVVQAPWVKGTTGSAALLNFHGGTLVATLDDAPGYAWIDASVPGVYIYSEGATIDTGAHTVTAAAPLLAPTDLGVQSIELGAGGMDYIGAPVVKITADSGSGSGAAAIANVDLNPASGTYGQVTGFTVVNPGSGYKTGETLTAALYGGGHGMMPAVAGTVMLNSGNVSGGLTKKGTGTLTLAATNTYTGATTVQEGKLAITGSIISDVTVDAAAALSGTGTITGDVDLNGTFAVAYNSDSDTINLLTITDQLDLTGGTISFSDTGTGTLAEGTYVFAAYGSRVGTATTVTGLQSGWSIDYAYDYNGGTDNSIALLVSGVQIPGDANGDGKVNDVDAKTVAQNWGASGATWAMGDFSKDGVVNAVDASIMAANWGHGVTEAAAVPEPSVLAALLVGLFALASGTRTRRRA
jgi:autotransporter-associated beta strand protein